MIKKTEHCLLCENRQHNVEHGVYCGLTDKKPDFNKTCNLIKFGKALEDNILDKNVELRLVEKTKVDTLGHLVIFLSIGLVVIFFGVYLLGNYGFNFTGDYFRGSAYVTVVASAITFIGVSFLVNAFTPLNLFFRNLKVAKTNKEKLDSILNEYKLEYELELSIHKKWPNDIDVEHKLDIHPKHQEGKHLIN